MNEEYFTEHPWSGDNGSHEDWEKVLTLKALPWEEISCTRTSARSPTCVPLFFFPHTHPACAGEFLGCAAAPTSSATRTQQRLSTSN